MRTLQMIGVALLTLAASSALLAQDVTYDFDKSFDFSKVKTYAWVDGTRVRDDLIHKRLIDAFDSQFTAKGLKKVEVGENPDVAVAYHASFDEETAITGWSSGMAGWGAWRYGGGMTSTDLKTSKVIVGSILLDIMDPKEKTIVWRGLASKEVDVKASPEKRDKNINMGAEKLMKNFPPKPKD